MVFRRLHDFKAHSLGNIKPLTPFICDQPPAVNYSHRSLVSTGAAGGGPRAALGLPRCLVDSSGAWWTPPVPGGLTRPFLLPQTGQMWRITSSASVTSSGG